MNFFDILYNIIIAPLEMIIETVFCFELTKIGIFGAAGAIVAVSLTVGFLTLPIYNVADAIQKRERDTAATLAPDIAHIKKAFTGDERFMLISTLYRQNHYHPIMTFRSSLSIIIEVPFFIAAYHFLSHCPSLHGVSCGILHDLGKPDGLIAFSAGGGRSLASVSGTLNLLPVLMTAINAVSSAVYLKGFSLREKAQTYCLALIFLVLLYNSPSGLVLYWTLNNLFSLAKNMAQRWCKRPGLFVYCFVAVMALLVALFILVARPNVTLWKRVAVLAGAIVFAATPYVARLIQTRVKNGKSSSLRLDHNMRLGSNLALERTSPAGEIASGVAQEGRIAMTDTLLFLASACGLALLCGLVLPASCVATSPTEFSFIGEVSSPLYYVVRSLCVFTGLCVLWPFVIYFMLGSDIGDGHTQDNGLKLDVSHSKKMLGYRVKRVMPPLFTFALVMALLDAYVFRFQYGTMNVFFHLDDRGVLTRYGAFHVAGPLVAAVCVGVFLWIIMCRKMAVRNAAVLVAAVCVAEAGFATVKMHSIHQTHTAFAVERKTEEKEDALAPIYHLSRDGKNVVILFIDRAVGSYIPYIKRQFPSLDEDMTGFVYYPNTVSFGMFTSLAAPAMMGGYEYTPDNENKRPDERIRDKNSEAQVVLPRLFADIGWQAIVTDPPNGDSGAASFQNNRDLCFGYVTHNYYAPYIKQMGQSAKIEGERHVGAIKKYMAGFCIMEVLPPLFRRVYYDWARYFQINPPTLDYFLQEYAQLYYMGNITDVVATKGSYVFIGNMLPHQAAILGEPGYVPDENAYLGTPTSGYFEAADMEEMKSYHVNTAAVLQVAQYMKRLKEMGVYDNTRVIVVSDHGDNISAPPVLHLPKDAAARSNPLLMVKDFGATGPIRTDSTFMTNADTLLLATAGLPVSDKNPFTGARYADVADKSVVHVHSHTENAALKNMAGDATVWPIGDGASWTVHDDVFDESNWTRVDSNN